MGFIRGGQAIREAVSTNPRNIIDTATDTVPTVGFRHALNMVFFSLGMEMGAQLGPDAHSQMLRADLWVRMAQTGGGPMPWISGCAGGKPSYRKGGRWMVEGGGCPQIAQICAD